MSEHPLLEALARLCDRAQTAGEIKEASSLFDLATELVDERNDLLEALNLLYTAGWRALRGNPEHITADLLEKAGAAIDKAVCQS